MLPPVSSPDVSNILRNKITSRGYAFRAGNITFCYIPAMSVNRISDLRISGKLREAYSLAEVLLNSDSTRKEDIPAIKKAMGWVLFEYLSAQVARGNAESTQKVVKKIAELDLDVVNKDLFSQYAWKIGKEVFRISSEHKRLRGMDVSQGDDRSQYAKLQGQVQVLFSFCRKYPPNRPSREYSFLMNAFLSVWKKERQFLDFADWWGFEHFLDEDFVKVELPDGKIISSLAERALLAYTEPLIKDISPSSGRAASENDRVIRFLPVLEKLTSKHSDFEFANYSLAKLFNTLGQNNDALEAVLPFAKKNRDKYWVWDFLGDLHPDDPDLQIACYCKALMIKAPAKYLSRIHLKLARLCVEKNHYGLARTEIERYLAIRRNNGWSISALVSQWQMASWYSGATVSDDNLPFYQKYSGKALNILYGEVPEQPIVVTHIHHTRPILHFMKNREQKGFLNFSILKNTPGIGDVLLARLLSQGTDGYHELLDARPAVVSDLPEQDFFRDFQGKATIPPGKPFGFVKASCNIFLPPEIVEKHVIKDEQQLSGRAIAQFDKKKKRWGWAAISLMTTSQRQ